MSKGRAKRIRVGIIGANPDRGWATQAHIPALRSLADDFEITALSTSRRESADAASKLFDVPAAFDNHQDLVSNPAVDVVAVTVKVPYHLELATAALETGEAVYCEWPLGNGLHEAEALAALAKNQVVLAVAGLQARCAPADAYGRDLVAPGYVGEVHATPPLRTALHAPGLENKRQRRRSAAHRHRRPGPDLGAGRPRWQRRAVLARAPPRARAILVGSAARPGHQRRASVRPFRPRLSRGDAFL